MPFDLYSKLKNQTSEQFRILRRAIVTLVVIAAISLISFAWSTGKISHQLNRFDLLPQPERLTELSFTTSNKLPTTYAPGQLQSVNFTVHDIEYRTTNYSYTITQGTVNSTNGIVLAQGYVTLVQNQSKALSIPITFIAQGTSSQINVNLTYQGIISNAKNLSQESESIHYIVSQVGAQ